MAKILVIGQAPPIQHQQYPYDTTLWYDWLFGAGITKEQSVDIFTYNAVFDKFPGKTRAGGHKAPLKDQKVQHYNNSLRAEIQQHDKIIVLGNVASDFLKERILGKQVLHLIHPSRRNYSRIKPHREEIINSLKNFIL